MNTKDFTRAIDILTHYHSNEIVINKVKENGQCPDFMNPTIHIKSCVPSVVNELVTSGFMLSMSSGLLSVDKI